MKRFKVLRQGSFLYPLVNVLLIISMLFILFPTVVPEARADDTDGSTESVTPDESLPSDNITPISTIKLVNPDEDTVLLSSRENISLTFPKGAVSEQVEVTLSEHPSTQASMVNMFELNAKRIDNEEKVSQFNKGLAISIQHTQDELAGLDLESLNLYYLDEKSHNWVPIPSQFDQETLTLTATIDHFSYYGEQANPLINGPGRIMAAEVNLHSGAATYSYPLELPPGPGGFQPSLTLTYNSGSVDGMKNKRDVGSWVGIGWDLSLGRITLDPTTKEHYLEINGASYKLVTKDGIEYFTNPDNYYKIIRSPQPWDNFWEMWDRDGNYYQFGGTTESRQYLPNAMYYRWDLNLIRDTNDNQAEITYVQEIIDTGITSCVRAAYPVSLEYGYVNSEYLVEVSFVSNDSRPDNPTDTVSIPAPKVMDTHYLDSIEIRVSDNLIRSYSFDYTTTASCVEEEQYGSISYSGTHTLDSITQLGWDGDDSEALPEMSFSYESKRVYRWDSHIDYFGNPGSPAEIFWPYLTTVDNGFGGEVAFTYAQNPGGNPQDIWTRQVITNKTIDDGIGIPQSVDYEYTGDPQYLGVGWNQKYRGFSQVKEIDVEQNYVIHHYYTMGSIEEERLTGREYQTQWYEPGSPDVLLRQVDYTWTAHETDSVSEATYINYFSQLYPTAMAVSPDGYLYVIEDRDDDYYDRVCKWNPDGTWAGEVFPPHTLSDPYDVAVSSDGYVYVTDHNNHMVRKYHSDGTPVLSFNLSIPYPLGIAVAPDGKIYVSSAIYDEVYEFTSNGQFTGNTFSLLGLPYYYNLSIPANSSDSKLYITASAYDPYSGGFGWVDVVTGSYDSGNIGNYPYIPYDIDVSEDGDMYVAYENSAGQEGVYICNSEFEELANLGWINDCYGVAAGNQYFYASSYTAGTIVIYAREFSNWSVQLDQVLETTYTYPTGSKTAKIEYEYDDYNNIKTEKIYGDTSTDEDNATVHRTYNYNTTANILNKPAEERVYATITGDVGGDNLKAETFYYYDGNNTSLETDPTKGNLTRVESMKDAENSVSSYTTYDTYGNVLTSTDPNENTTTWTFETTYHTYPEKKTLPQVGDLTLTEEYDYDPGTTNLLSMTDVNNVTTSFTYDTLDRLIEVDKEDDDTVDIEYEYNSWGTPELQHILTKTYYDENNYLWQSQYFDGLGRVIQVHSQGEDDNTIVSGTITFNDRGLVENEYITQELASVSGYTEPDGWLYTSYTYDALGRVLTQTTIDGDTISHDYSTAWQDLVFTPGLNDQTPHQKRYYYDAFNRLIKVEELYDNGSLYATTTYEYDTLGNLTQVKDDDNNMTTMTYDWLSRKTGMTDPDMGSWSYVYDNNGNLTSQTDAKNQTITMTYDAMNRITAKNYPQESEPETGPIVIITINCGEPPTPPSVTTSAASNVTTTSATLNGSLTSLGSAESVDMSFEWGLDTSYGNTIAGTPSQLTESGTFTGSLSNLTPETTYHYRAKADGGASGVSYGADQQFTTSSEGSGPVVIIYINCGEPPTPPSITTSAASDVTATSATMNGSLTSLGSAESVDVSFEWGLDTSYGNTVSGTPSTLTEPGAFTASLSELEPDTTYHYRAKADGGTSGVSYGADQQFTTSSAEADVVYSYDSTTGGNYGKGQRTGMTDAAGSATYKYDSWGRLTEEKRTIDSVDYITQFTYDGADRVETITYPTGETVTQDYNGRGFPDSLSGSTAGDVVDSVLYNSLGMMTEINLHNGVTTAYEYWGIDEPGGYYGRLFNINTNDGSTDLADIEYTWDAAGNLTTRKDVIAQGETETFTYDFLDRLTGASVVEGYSESYSYDEIGNITSRNGNSYTYGSQPHAVTSVGSTSYAYDANGNMTARGSQTLTWDVENRLISVSGGASFVYDGNGNRVMKTEGGETILYVNQYYEKNLTTGVVTTYYYLGGKLVAMREGTDLKYTHDDHLTSTSVMTDDTGDSLGAIKYLPFGETRSGSVPTDKLFTGQRLDDTGLYFYNARYYDATIGRFISADTIIPNPMNPQAFNRYSYCFNNPLKYVDPSGYKVVVSGEDYRIIQEMLQRDDLSSAEWWFLLSVVTSPEYKAYEAYRKSYRESADELEESEKTILFKTGDTSGYDIMSQQNDDVFTITLDQDLIGISGHEEYWRTLISFEILRIQPFLFVHKTRDELRQDLADVLMVSADILDVSSAGSDAIPPEYIVYAAGAYLGITLSAPYVAFAILCVGALGPDALRLAADVVAP